MCPTLRISKSQNSSFLVMSHLTVVFPDCSGTPNCPANYVKDFLWLHPKEASDSSNFPIIRPCFMFFLSNIDPIWHLCYWLSRNMNTRTFFLEIYGSIFCRMIFLTYCMYLLRTHVAQNYTPYSHSQSTMKKRHQLTWFVVSCACLTCLQWINLGQLTYQVHSQCHKLRTV
jgi:hypothetical protein